MKKFLERLWQALNKAKTDAQRQQIADVLRKLLDKLSGADDRLADSFFEDLERELDKIDP